MDAQIKKGILEMCVLHIISKEDKYGYDVMKQMGEYFPEVNESTFYAILRRLKNEQLAEVYYGDISNGPQRKYYRITEQGRIALSISVSDWKELIKIFGILGI